MKILAVTPESYGGFGGVAVYNIDTINALADLEYVKELHVVPRVIREAPLDMPYKVVFYPEAAQGLAAYGRTILKAAIKGRYDLILCTHMYLLPFARLAAGFSRRKIGVILYGVEAWMPTKRGLTNYLTKRSEPIISISDYTAERFSQWTNILEADVKLLPNAFHGEGLGLGPKPQYLIERHGLEGRKVLMTLGRMDARERQKGFDEVIDLMPDLLIEDSSLYYLLAGDGDDRQRLEAKVHGLGLSDHIGFAGRVSETEKADYYRLADVFTMAGRQEGFGFVFIEALACGTPCVGSSVDGSRYALLHGKLGELADPSAPQTIKDAIFKAMEKPREIPEGLEFFSYENFVSRLDNILRPYAPKSSLKSISLEVKS